VLVNKEFVTFNVGKHKDNNSLKYTNSSTQHAGLLSHTIDGCTTRCGGGEGEGRGRRGDIEPKIKTIT